MTTIDLNKQYPITLVTDEQGQTLVRVDLSRVTKDPTGDPSPLIEHLREAMTLEHDGVRVPPIQSALQAQHLHCLDFPIQLIGLNPNLRLMMRDEPVAHLGIAGHGIVEPREQHAEYQLAACEVRGLNMALQRDTEHPRRNVLGKLPYSRAERAGFDPAVHAPVTDVHTHLSAQIKADDLLNVAFAADEHADAQDPQRPIIAYPTELLEQLGFKYRKDDPRLVAIKGRGFTPMRDEGLTCEKEGADCTGIRITQLTDAEKQAIVRQMQIAPDMTMDSGDFDREMYRYRNPFIKHPALAKPVIKKVAEDYARMGVRYAELSTGSMMNPDWFRAMTEALDEIARDGVGPEHKKPILRFLVGLPRNISPQETLITLEKIKYLARHPAIVGIDLLGYESNKTSDFNWALANMADWARAPDGRSDLNPSQGWDFKDQFIIRVHAGETTKNVHNVRDAIKIAHQYGVRVRIGHAINAKLDGTAAGWLREMNADESRDWIGTERCPDSNQVYRTKKLVHNQPPMLECAKFIGTDGGGALNTDPVNLAYSSLAGSWTLPELASNQQFERRYIDRQHMREKKKTAAFEQHYGKGTKGLDAFLDGYQVECSKIPDMRAKKLMTDYLPAQFMNSETGKPKRPVLIVGASGSTWQELECRDQETIRRAARALVLACDPQKTYFVLGRATKETADGKNSVSNIIDEEIRAHNMAHPDNKFAVLGRYAGASKFPTGDLAETISWIQDIEQGRDDVPRSMIAFTKRQNGVVITLAGSEFTAQMAYGASYKKVPHALHTPVTDLRNDKDSDLPLNPLDEASQTVKTHSRFSNYSEFVDRAFDEVGEQHLFRNESERDHFVREGLDINKLHKINLTHRERAEEKTQARERG